MAKDKSLPATQAASVALWAMMEASSSVEFHKAVGVPPDLSDDPPEAFFTGIHEGLSLARTLLRFMGTQTVYTLQDMEEVVDHIVIALELNESLRQ